VTFDIDANGILKVFAKDRATNKEQSIRIEASTGLSKEEVDKMVNDAKAHAAEDKKKREVIDLRNRADQMVYQTEKNIADMGDKIDANSKSRLETAAGRVKEAIKADNSDDFEVVDDNKN